MRTASLLLLLALSQRRAAAAVRGSPIITGKSSAVSPRRDRSLRGAVIGKPQQVSRLPVADGRRRLQMGDPKKTADVVPQDLLPTVDDVPFVDDSLFDDQFWEEDSCKLVTFNETFYFTTPVARDATGTYGERYYFDNDLNRTDGTQVEDVKLTGSCTRTRLSGDLGTAGAGVCNFIIYHTLGNWSMSTSGFLETAAASGIGGTLAVTGGTGEMVSVMGEMDVWPMDINGMLATGDIFDTVYGYYVNAIYGLLICPKPYHITPVNTTAAATAEPIPVGGPGVYPGGQRGLFH